MDNKYSHNWEQSNFGSCGLWRQVHAGVGPGQSLSCPHSAQSRSRDLPRGIGGPPGEAGVGCGSLGGWGGKDNDSRDLRNILLLVLFFFVFLFVSFCSVVVFLFFIFYFFFIFLILKYFLFFYFYFLLLCVFSCFCFVFVCLFSFL